MKISLKLFVTAITTTMFVGASAQKAKVVSAYNYNKSYERDKDCSELVKGIAAIEPASKDPKTSLYAKTWYYGGNLYFNAALSSDADCAAKFDNSLQKAYDFYVTSIKYNITDESAASLDLEKDADQLKFAGFIMNRETEYNDISYMRDIMGQKFPYLANSFVNKGVEAFQNKEFKKAKEYSLNSVSINEMMGKVDSLGLYNGALAAERLNEDEDAIELYTALTQIKYGGPVVHLYIANIHDANGDTTKKLEAIRKGLEQYPDDPDLVREELNFLLQTGQTDEALKNFDKAIANEPENSSLYYNRGLINDQLGKQDLAAKDYKKAFDLDPKFFDAAYNLGAMYYNLGVEWNNKASNYGLNETTKYKEASKKANDYFTLARPALEKAHSINAEDKNTMASLTKIYAIEGDDEKYGAMKAKLQAK
ncbi:MAG: tetratricopeptide repeat protein [Flavobacteriales bacterium]|nr:tetratricopeptide repeat protein [Flavobacteriales bacterium]